MSLKALFILAVSLIFSGKLIRLISKRMNTEFEAEYTKFGFLSRHFISSRFTERQFEDWCKYILKNMQHKNLENVSEDYEGGVNLISTNNNIKTYISTRLYELKDNEKNKQKKNIDDDYKTVGRPEVQKFVGAMVHDKVKNGVIITTGDFTKEAREYIKSLPKEYLLIPIDGIELTKELRKIRRREITARVASGLTN